MLADVTEDQDPRRREVLDALLRITRRDGLDAVSVRTVAAEAGTSLGFVQRQFHTKDELVKAAFEHSLELLGRRIEPHIVGIEPGCPARVFLQPIAELLLLTEQEHVHEARVWIAFLARAAIRPELATELRAHYQGGHDLIAITLRLSQQYGEAPPDLDPDEEAVALMALIDGLSVANLIGRCDDATARKIVARHLDRVFRR